MFVAILFLATGCGDKEEKVCNTEDAVVDVSNTDKVSKDCQDLCAKKGIDGDTCKAYCSDERKKGVCYAACEGSAGYCKKVCYGKKPATDVVDSPDDVTATRVDTISVPADVSGTNG
jgi:hypothetical protein